MNEKCGVVAIASNKNVVEDIYVALMALQHRGQEAAGISVYDGGIKSIKGIGLVNEALKKDDLGHLKGNGGIGHVYYSVTISIPENAQPSVFHTAMGDIAIAHNGIITNSEDLKQELMKKGHNFIQGSEEESFAYLLSDSMKEKNFEKAVKYAMKRMKGSYSVTLMFNNKVYGLRDAFGIKPLCLGKIKDGYIIASESVAIDALGGELIRDVEPGELIEITPDGYKSYILMKEKYKAH